MTAKQLLKEFQSDNKYKKYSEINELLKDTPYSVRYQNKYTSFIVDDAGDVVIVISCRNVYGCQMIESFR